MQLGSKIKNKQKIADKNVYTFMAQEHLQRTQTRIF